MVKQCRSCSSVLDDRYQRSKESVPTGEDNFRSACDDEQLVQPEGRLLGHVIETFLPVRAACQAGDSLHQGMVWCQMIGMMFSLFCGV